MQPLCASPALARRVVRITRKMTGIMTALYGLCMQVIMTGPGWIGQAAMRRGLSA